LLAVYGIDDKGRTYVHCRVYKQNRVYGDWIAHGGEVKLLCRECLRWHVIRFIDEGQRAVLQESAMPAEVDGSGIVGRDMKKVEGI
jgi:hypothetical protein